MIPTANDHFQLTPADDTKPRFFLDDAYNADLDGDWWLDLGGVDLPNGQVAPTV
jgi:hypothetical protein